jgi:hypothetical protein
MYRIVSFEAWLPHNTVEGWCDLQVLTGLQVATVGAHGCNLLRWNYAGNL